MAPLRGRLYAVSSSGVCTSVSGWLEQWRMWSASCAARVLGQNSQPGELPGQVPGPNVRSVEKAIVGLGGISVLKRAWSRVEPLRASLRVEIQRYTVHVRLHEAAGRPD